VAQQLGQIGISDQSGAEAARARRGSNVVCFTLTDNPTEERIKRVHEGGGATNGDVFITHHRSMLAPGGLRGRVHQLAHDGSRRDSRVSIQLVSEPWLSAANEKSFLVVRAAVFALLAYFSGCRQKARAGTKPS